MATDRKIFELQQKLYLKSKQEYDFKFYSIFDKIYRKDILSNLPTLKPLQTPKYIDLVSKK